VRRSLPQEAIVARAKAGEAISDHRRSPAERAKLDALAAEAKKGGDLKAWRRARALQRYIDGDKVIAIAEDMDVCRAAVNQWLRWYEAQGADGLRSRKAPGPPPRLSQDQRDELVALIEAGPQTAGYSGGVWSGPRIGHLIHKCFGVRYHKQHVPRLLAQLGFSLQRPRKRLARADAEAQAVWVRERLPAIKKKRDAAAES
jgi:putative transposase